MAIKVRIRNFQSIRDATIVVEGLTVITGRNNCGKSVVVRAIRAALTNAKGTGYVRYGTDKCIVEIDFGDGRSLYWEKGEKVKPMYVIDGGQPIYPGQGVPQELAELGMVPVAAGGQAVWPQIASQFTGQMFLLDQPGSALAEVVADVDRVGHLNRALKACESDRRKVESELKVRRSDEIMHAREVEFFDGLDEATGQVTQVEADAAKIEKIQKVVAGLTVLRDRIDGAQKVVGMLAGVEKISIPEDDQIAALQSDLDQLDVLLALQKNLDYARTEVETLAGIEALGVSVDSTLVEKVKAGLDVLDGLKARWTAALGQVTRVEEDLARVEAEASKAAQEVRDILGDLRECPTCGQAAG